MGGCLGESGLRDSNRVGGGYLDAMGLTPGANSETASDFWGQEQASKTYLAPPP